MLKLKTHSGFHDLFLKYITFSLNMVRFPFTSITDFFFRNQYTSILVIFKKQITNNSQKTFCLLEILLMIRNEPEIIHSCCSIFNCLCCVVYIIVCSFVLFHFVLVSSVFLLFTTSDYPFGIFIFFLDNKHSHLSYYSLVLLLTIDISSFTFLNKKSLKIP